MKKYAFGVDIGGTSIKIGLMETNGDMVETWEIPTNREQSGSRILSDIAEALVNKMEENNIVYDDIEGVGFGVPGPVLSHGIVNGCANLGWGTVDIPAIMSRLTGIDKIRVANDANAAALGEMWKGGGQGNQNVVMVTLGTGVGGGVVLGGEIIPGTFGAAGEIGHMTYSAAETEQCGCGKRGCLEQYASATGIVRMAKRKLQRDERRTVLRGLPALSAKEVFDAAKENDMIALELTDDLGEALGIALSHVSCVIDPEVFVIGGGLSGAGNILLDSIKKHYEKHAFHASRNAVFELAKLGNQAGIYGAVYLLLN